MRPSHGSPARRRSEALVLVVATGVANVSNYVFHVLMTRALGPADYGALGALLGLLLVLTVPTSAIQAVVARWVSSRNPVKDDPAATVHRTARATMVPSLAIAGVVLAASPLVAPFLRMDSPAPVALLALTLVPMLVAPVGRGALQGSRRFALLGASIVAGTAVRLGLSIALTRAGMGLAGAIASLLAAEAVAAAIALAPFARRAAATEPGVGRRLLREGTQAGGALLAFWILVSVDVVFARRLLPEAASGGYAAAALVGRAVLFLPAALITLAYPTMVQRAGTAGGREATKRLLAVVAACGVAGTAGLVMLPGLPGAIFGDAYRGAADTATMLALAMTAFGAVHVLLYERLALRRVPGRGLWIAVVAECGALALSGGRPSVMALALLATGLGTATWLFAGGTHARRAVPTGELWSIADPAIELSVVTPTFNGESVIAPSLRRLLTALADAGIRSEVIVVSDGSTDGTVRAARPFESEGVRVLHYDDNQGKGYALRTGLARASGRTVAYIDSDGDLEPITLVRFLTLMRMYDADMVIGSKRHPLSDCRYPPLRWLMSWTYHKLVRLLFGIRVSDTQTGVKLVRRELLATVLPRLEEKRFAFDLELIAAARRAGYRRILEAPIVLRYQFASTVSWRSVVGIMRDTAAIWARCHLTRRYDPEPDGATAPVAPAAVVPSRATA